MLTFPLDGFETGFDFSAFKRPDELQLARLELLLRGLSGEVEGKHAEAAAGAPRAPGEASAEPSAPAPAEVVKGAHRRVKADEGGVILEEKLDAAKIAAGLGDAARKGGKAGKGDKQRRAEEEAAAKKAAGKRNSAEAKKKPNADGKSKAQLREEAAKVASDRNREKQLRENAEAKALKARQDGPPEEKPAAEATPKKQDRKARLEKEQAERYRLARLQQENEANQKREGPEREEEEKEKGEKGEKEEKGEKGDKEETEEGRIAEDVTRQRAEEEKRMAEEERRTAEEEAKRAEDAKRIEEQRRVEEERRRLEEQRRRVDEEKRIEEHRHAEEDRRAEEQMRVIEERQSERALSQSQDTDTLRASLSEREYAQEFRERLGAQVHVALTEGKWEPGKLMFVGPLQGKDPAAVFAGVALPYAGGRNDGAVDGVRYFTCDAKCGVFVRCSPKRLMWPPKLAHVAPADQSAHVGRLREAREKRKGAK